MILAAFYFAFACFTLGILMCLGKILWADTLTDRILALDAMFINAIALVVLYGVVLGTEIFFEAALLMAMLGFISTVAYARFLLRGNIIE